MQNLKFLAFLPLSCDDMCKIIFFGEPNRCRITGTNAVPETIPKTTIQRAAGVNAAGFRAFRSGSGSRIQHRSFILEHKFEIGQGLNFTPRRTTYGLSRSACEVVRLLPNEGDEPQYRIKCSNENFERVVRESELD
jgi:hypothetical protein